MLNKVFRSKKTKNQVIDVKSKKIIVMRVSSNISRKKNEDDKKRSAKKFEGK